MANGKEVKKKEPNNPAMDIINAAELGGISAMAFDVAAGQEVPRLLKGLFKVGGVASAALAVADIIHAFAGNADASEKGSHAEAAQPRSLAERVLAAAGSGVMSLADGLTFGVASMAVNAGDTTRQAIAEARTRQGQQAASREQHREATPIANEAPAVTPNAAPAATGAPHTHHGWTDAARAASAQARGVRWGGGN